MEQKHVLLSALSVGVGVGVGLGLASGEAVGKWAGLNCAPEGLTSVQIEQELLRLVVDGGDSNITFPNFPYYLSERIRVLLTSAACVHLNHADFFKYTRNLSPASRAILLSGPAELYQQMLAKALAHHFGAKLLMLDVIDFSLKMQSKYGCAKKDSSFRRSMSEVAIGRMSRLFESFSILPPRDEIRGTLQRWNSRLDIQSRGTEGAICHSLLRRNASSSMDMSGMASQCTSTSTARSSGWCFDDKLLLQSLYKVLVSISQKSSIILYIRDVDKLLVHSKRFYILFHKMLKKLSGSILILGSGKLVLEDDCEEVDDRVSSLFPYNIEIKALEDENHLVSWKTKLEEDMKMIQFQDNKNHITEVLAANDLECDDLGSICQADTMVLSNYIEEIVVSAISYHLMNDKYPKYRSGKLVISSKSLSHGLSLFQEGKKCGKDTVKLETNAEVSKSLLRESLIPNQRLQNLRVKAGMRIWYLRQRKMLKTYLCQNYQIMVGLPSAENRTMILKTLVEKEKVDDLDYKELAAMTDGFSGSDLKHVHFVFMNLSCYENTTYV